MPRSIVPAWKLHLRALWLLVWLLPLPGMAQDTVTDQALRDTVAGLTNPDFAAKQAVIEQLMQMPHRRSAAILTAMLNGDLNYRKDDGRVVIAQAGEADYRLTDPVTGEDLGSAEKSGLKKITVNNQLRGVLRNAIGQLNLSSGDPADRLAAVRETIKDMSPTSIELLRAALAREKDSRVLEQMQNALALVDMGSPDKSVRLGALERLGGSLEPEVRNRLAALIEQDGNGAFVEADPDIRQAAVVALARIDNRVKIFGLMETVFFGISLGSVLLLAAIGLAITFGVMGVINMAHGELMMIGAYTTYVVQLMMPAHIDLSLFVAVPLAFVVAGLFGILIERGVIRFLYGRPLETLLATFGISLVLQQMVRSIFSPLNRSVATPSWMSGSLEINSVLSLTYNRLYIVLFSLLVFAALLLILKKSRLGLQVRAVAQNRAMARAMGVRSDWVDALTFGLGSGIAGVAGVALSQLTNVGPNLGQAYIIDSFMVVVFGGVGNLWGTLVGALSLGVVNKFLEPWSGAVLAKIFVLVAIILFIQKRPRGLFPQKGRAAED
ncbi:MAG: urea ABC transporter permease subunit UrtB [Gammaproteobacteria bacterium]|nr:urea ABC transporter permease subunit UrtB [Gammaproteobacteria bacterium]